MGYVTWLTDVSTAIMALAHFSAHQRGLALHWAAELASVCDESLPDVPRPTVDTNAEGTLIKISWVWRLRGRVFSILVGEAAVSIWMSDADRNSVIFSPRHDELKRSLMAFFEGWVRQ